ncbi:hypothetical protein [Nonomuraea sp. NPDC049480]|uniref:hypothetical protein n=1 Tax=Nonomuraea sp. NPDC049480 TaxID=3364353 RepID=UPI0037BD4164
MDFLHTDPRDGTLVVSPSYSPEHGVARSERLFVLALCSVPSVLDGGPRRHPRGRVHRLGPQVRLIAACPETAGAASRRALDAG